MQACGHNARHVHPTTNGLFQHPAPSRAPAYTHARFLEGSVTFRIPLWSLTQIVINACKINYPPTAPVLTGSTCGVDPVTVTANSTDANWDPMTFAFTLRNGLGVVMASSGGYTSNTTVSYTSTNTAGGTLAPGTYSLTVGGMRAWCYAAASSGGRDCELVTIGSAGALWTCRGVGLIPQPRDAQE